MMLPLSLENDVAPFCVFQSTIAWSSFSSSSSRASFSLLRISSISLAVSRFWPEVNRAYSSTTRLTRIGSWYGESSETVMMSSFLPTSAFSVFFRYACGLSVPRKVFIWRMYWGSIAEAMIGEDVMTSACVFR